MCGCADVRRKSYVKQYRDKGHLGWRSEKEEGNVDSKQETKDKHKRSRAAEVKRG